MKISEDEIKKISELSALKNVWGELLKKKFESVIDFISKLDWIKYEKNIETKKDNLRLNKEDVKNNICLWKNIKHKKTNNWINIKSSI